MMDRRGRGRADFEMDWQMEGWMDAAGMEMAACQWDLV